MEQDDLRELHVTYGNYIRNNYMTLSSKNRLALIITISVAFSFWSEAQPQARSSSTVNIFSINTANLPYTGATKDGIIKATNTIRHNKGLPPLAENALLNRIANERLEDMFQKRYFAHESPSGEKASTIAQRVGYRYKLIAENIAFIITDATDEEFLLIWMQSPGHRANILDPEIKEIGAATRKGHFKDGNNWIGVQIFGLRA